MKRHKVQFCLRDLGADRANVGFRGAVLDRGVKGAKPPENLWDFMLILDPESTCNWHCNKKSNSPSGCKNEQQVGV